MSEQTKWLSAISLGRGSQSRIEIGYIFLHRFKVEAPITVLEHLRHLPVKYYAELLTLRESSAPYTIEDSSNNGRSLDAKI